MARMKHTVHKASQVCLLDWAGLRRWWIDGTVFRSLLPLLPLLPLLIGVFFLASPNVLEATEPKSNGKALGNILWLQLCDTSSMELEVLDELVLEVSRFYTPPAPRILWDFGCALPLHQASPQLWVVIMTQLPHAVKLRHQVFRSSAPLAWYGQNRRGSVVYVSRDAVAGLLGRAASQQSMSELLPRALGRVVAHELGHHFFGTQHTHTGLMKRELSRYDLMSSSAKDLTLTREQLESMHGFVQGGFPAEAKLGRKIAEPPS